MKNPELNGYIGFYKGKKYEIYSDTTYHAQQEIAKKYKIKKPYEITVMLAEKGGKPVTHLPLMNPKDNPYAHYVIGKDGKRRLIKSKRNPTYKQLAQRKQQRSESKALGGLMTVGLIGIGLVLLLRNKGQ